MVKILFLDLDGTVRETISGKTFINDPHDQKLIDGVESAIARYQDWVIIGITNQGGVGSGHKTLDNCIAEQLTTLKFIPQMDCIYFCPDMEGNQCYFISRDRQVAVHKTWNKYKSLTGFYRKPMPGMIDLAIARCFAGYDYGTKCHRAKCLFVGDRAEDKQCAENANIPFMWAEDWRK